MSRQRRPLHQPPTPGTSEDAALAGLWRIALMGDLAGAVSALAQGAAENSLRAASGKISSFYWRMATLTRTAAIPGIDST